MIKYVPEDTSVTFSEIPDEITLCINISECQCHCKGCHSSYLWSSVGEELTEKVLDKLLHDHEGITCICFMGEGNDQQRLQELITYVHNFYTELKIGLYSGRERVDEDFYWDNLNYLKIGPYNAEYGPLNKETTNQRLYHGGKYYSWCCVVDDHVRFGWHDITSKFWKKKN